MGGGVGNALKISSCLFALLGAELVSHVDHTHYYGMYALGAASGSFFHTVCFQAFSRLWLQLTSPMWVFASVLRSEVIEPLTATCPRSNIVESWIDLYRSSLVFVKS